MSLYRGGESTYPGVITGVEAEPYNQGPPTQKIIKDHVINGEAHACKMKLHDGTTVLDIDNVIT